MTPDITFLLLTFNQEAQVERAMKAALAQAGVPIEIMVSDDCSRDATFAIATEIARGYTGCHRVVVRQTASNRGLIGHIEEAVREATGRLIVIAAGDDVSSPERVNTLREAWAGTGSTSTYIYSGVRGVTESGEDAGGAMERIYSGPHSLTEMAAGFISALGATAAFTRDIVGAFASVSHPVRHEDRVFPFRAALLGGSVVYVDQPLVDYCMEGGVSRDRPVDRMDYLTRWTRTYNLRTIEDARQRLDDARAHHAAPEIIALCRRTIEHQKAMIALSEQPYFGRELATLSGLLKGAYVVPLLRHYLKFRLPIGRRNF